MKKLFITFIITLGSLLYAQAQIESIDLAGKKYTVTKTFPSEIIGKYLYEGKGEPIVLLNDDGTGLFQPHMKKPIQIKFWIDCDEKGVIRKQQGSEGRYQYTLLIQYLNSDNGNYSSGKYDLMDVAILRDLKRVVIYGERYMDLKK